MFQTLYTITNSLLKFIDFFSPYAFKGRRLVDVWLYTLFERNKGYIFGDDEFFTAYRTDFYYIYNFELFDKVSCFKWFHRKSWQLKFSILNIIVLDLMCHTFIWQHKLKSCKSIKQGPVICYQL
jgi:hypothetical protein